MGRSTRNLLHARARAALTLAALAVTALTACGQEGAGSVGESTPAPSATSTEAPAPADPGASEEALTVTVTDGAGTSTTWTLTCPPDGEPGGDHPDPAGACAALTATKDPFAPVPKDMMCTQVFGGPETATVQGRWRGTDVTATFKRTDGCEIARWNRVAPLLQPGRAVSSGSGGT